ncbi:MAG: 30S ribosomal protein S19 [archaeon]|nr:30S ribosomal protein S19 [archaeon]
MAKELLWQGLTEEQVKSMDLKEFIELVNARQRRSLKRGLSEAQKALMERIEAGENNIKTHCRNMVIVPSMIGKNLRIYNGKDFYPITITLEMIGHCLGEFSHTRKMVTHSSAGVGATRSSKAVSAR